MAVYPQTFRFGIREAKAKFSALIALVKQGKKVIITEHNREVVQLTVVPEKEISMEEKLKSLEEQGVIKLAKKKLDPNHFKPIKISGIDTQKILQEDREDRMRRILRKLKK